MINRGKSLKGEGVVKRRVIYMMEGQGRLVEGRSSIEIPESGVETRKMYRGIQIGMLLIFIGLFIRAAAILILIQTTSETKAYLTLIVIGLIIQVAGAVLLSYVLIGGALKYKSLHTHIRAAMIIGSVVILAITLTTSIYPIWPYWPYYY